MLDKTLTKHWLHPYWQADELDDWLAAQETAGWRLERVGFFRRFVFRERIPMEAHFFSTYAYLKEAGLLDLGYQLKHTYKADELTPGFCGSLLLEHIYRITRIVEKATRLDFRQLRNAYLRHIAIQSILCSVLFLLPSSAILLFGRVGSTKQELWLVACAVLSFFSGISHIRLVLLEETMEPVFQMKLMK